MDVEGLTRRKLAVLVAATFVAGLCSIFYELLIGTVSSYFLGDSVRQFSLTIGLFMAAMGMGSFLSRRLGARVLSVFVAVEVLLGVLGGTCVPVLYAVYGYTDLYYPAMVLYIVAIGVLTGLEIPILVLVMRRFYTLEVNLSNILSLDYFGALAATLLFPFALLPTLGTFRSALAIGVLNLAIALLVLKTFRGQMAPGPHQRYRLAAWTSLLALVITFFLSPYLLKPWHDAVYEDRVVLVRQTPYQKIVLTRSRHDLRLFINSNLQFSSVDEYRYHEALVHPALTLAPHRGRVLLLGGGDGLAVREILAHDDVAEITVVDLDPAMTRLGREHRLLRALNHDSLRDPRVRIVNADAFVFLDEQADLYDVIIADLPDPNSVSLARLYSRELYRLVDQRLARTGVFVTQATSPFFAQKAFWTIHETVRDAGFRTWPYHAYVPSFGDWGFVMAARIPLEPAAARLSVPTRFLDDQTLARMFVFERDLRAHAGRVSTLDRPQVLTDYLEGWKHWN